MRLMRVVQAIKIWNFFLPNKSGPIFKFSSHQGIMEDISCKMAMQLRVGTIKLLRLFKLLTDIENSMKMSPRNSAKIGSATGYLNR